MLAGHDQHYVTVLWVIASAFGIAVLVVLGVVYRRALHRHEIEEADRVITEHDRGG